MPGKDDTTLTITDRPEVDTAEAAADEHDTPWGLASPMRVKKRDGGLEPVDLNKIVSAVGRAAKGLDGVDPMRVATRTISGLCDGATTMELDELSIRTAAALVSEEPSYSRLAGRLLATFVQKEVFNQNIHSFSQSIAAGAEAGLIGEETAALVANHPYKLNEAIEHTSDQLFEYFGLRTVYDRYLLRDPESRLVIETPQYFFMRVACGLSQSADEAVEFYRLISSLDYLPATPTLFNSGTTHPQMSSCFAAGTPVFTTNRGLVPIEQVVVGDETITHTGSTATITQIHVNPLGDRSLYDITCAGLQPITMTGNHRIWAANYGKKRGVGAPGWIDADSMQVGDYVALGVGHDLKGDTFTLSPLTHRFDRHLQFGEVGDDGMAPVSVRRSARDHLNGSDNEIVRTRAMSPVRAEWDFDSIHGARFLGQWFGDGSVMGGHARPDGISLTFGNGERRLAERWAEVGERIFGIKAHFYGESNGRGWGHVSFHSGVVGELFVATFGRHSHDKALPGAFYSMNRTFMENFLKGLIESDGFVHGRSASVTMTNLDLLAAVAAWGRSHGLPIFYSTVRQYEVSRFRRQASLRVPCWAIDLSDLGKVYDDDRIADLANAKPSTMVKVIGGRPFVRVVTKAAAEPVQVVYNLGVAHDDHSYSVNGLAVANCYLLDSPSDTLEAIYDRYKDVARLSKFAGGIGLAFHRVRSRGSLIRGTNGLSNGIVPWLKTLDSSVSAVNQGGKRKGAACVYLETWHADIEEFLELKDNTGDEARRTHNLNLANWVPDLFMQRVEQDWTWSLFDPKNVPHLTDLFGKEFERAYQEAESKKLYERQVPARQLYARMMRTLAQSGNGWMTFKDPSNARCNQTTDAPIEGQDGSTSPRVVHLSNLCTEILEVTSNDETAVCNLGSINLGHFVVADPDTGATGSGGRAAARFDFERLGRVARTAVRYLDRVIDINYYPTDEASASNSRWRPVGLGSMGLQDVLFKMRLPFDSAEARSVSKLIAEEIYFNALSASCELAEENGTHRAFPETRIAAGNLQFDLAGVAPTDAARWEGLRARIAEHGMRNSLLIAIAPTATIASIVGAYECIEPQVSNLFKRETLSGEFMQINTYLVRDLQERGLWTDEVRDAIKRAEGSVQAIDEIPDDIKALYRTAWELPMRSLIDMAAERGAFIDQSQSLNLFMESPTIGKLSSMYLHAWKAGLKTTYYMRSRPATRITQTTTNGSPPAAAAIAGVSPIKNEPAAEPTAEPTDEEVIACSLANPESCDSCQ